MLAPHSSTLVRSIGVARLDLNEQLFDSRGMGFNNPGVSWTELERRLSGRPPNADGGDSPAWSRHREKFEAPAFARQSSTTPYAELHCHSNFSFLDGASHPEELATEAARLGLEALAITDHDGFYGVVRFAEAAREVGIPTVFGTELSLGLTEPQNGVADPAGIHQIVLARDPTGYAALGSLISAGQMAGEKGAPRLSFSDIAEAACNGAADHWVLLTGGRKGAVPKALIEAGPAAAGTELQRLIDAVGRPNVYVELWDHGDPLDSARNDELARLSARYGVGLLATNNVHYATPSRRRLATALAAVRARRSLDEIDGWLPPSGAAHLRSGDEQLRRFNRYPGVVEAAAELGKACAFDLNLVAPSLPPFPCPPGHDEMSWLTELVRRGAEQRYGPRTAEWVPGAWKQIDRELALIDELGFPGYFLVVWDIVDFCRVNDIYCQGRGSAANSAVCFVLGITKADAVSLGLLFERFLSPERDGPPDIDLDIESGRREEAIQHVYERYGRNNAAQVANVITYRAKSSIRDMSKALGYATGQQDAFSKQLDRWGGLSDLLDGSAEQVTAGDFDVPRDVLELAAAVENFPRHLGIHSGGMVICDRPITEVCPIEWGRMANRSVLQWDKEDCATVGLVKFDLLGLGMLTALHLAVDLIGEHHDLDLDLAALPQDSAVYDMLCEADSVGVFQVESRAQMATLPRLRPRNFYDLVVEVALIRPGPIQGGSVHPYIRRRNGKEPVTYLHPLLENSLRKTLGIPLFQEQLMQMAIDVAGFTPAESDELRQAMGSKRSRERMAKLKVRLYEGMAERGIVGNIADEIFDKMAAFANYGFPESHSVSFAYLVYSSSWIKLYYPAAFCASLLNAQPMGFYSPQSLVLDARRHDVIVRTPDLNESSDKATLEPCSGSKGSVAVRLGLSSIRGIGDDLAQDIAENGPYESMEHLVRSADVNLAHLEALATGGAFGCFGLDRRAALWQAGAVIQSRPDRLSGIVTGIHAPQLPGMSDQEEAVADLWATGVSPDGHPTKFVREELDRLGAVTSAGMRLLESGTRIWVGGVVTHRQRPATAGGTLFINLEDETGLINVVCSRGCWIRYRRIARGAPALLVRGRLEASEGVYNLIAERIEPLPVAASVPSRDFR